MNKLHQNVKVVLLGDSACGKSSIARRYINGDFNEYSESTIGAAFCVKQMPEYNTKLELWDTAGQERYHSLAPMYYRGASAAVIVYDITKKETLAKAQTWIAELEKCNNKLIYIILVGNKCDLNLSRKVYPEDVENMCTNKYFHIETSAKTGKNITTIFETIAKNIQKNDTNNDNITNINLIDIPMKKNHCCGI